MNAAVPEACAHGIYCIFYGDSRLSNVGNGRCMNTHWVSGFDEGISGHRNGLRFRNSHTVPLEGRTSIFFMFMNYSPLFRC